ncbi:MAG: DNA alkylation repair protein [Planctomycetes bacterium]|nr:DNA alkylation repair protein [Planctomycetota bacterium]
MAVAQRPLIAAVRQELQAHGDPKKAAGAQAYMKSALPYYGVPTPLQRAIYRRVFAQYPLETFAAWRATVLELWRKASHREERYAAIALTEDKRHAAFQTLETLSLYEELIVTGAWWDYVDVIASHRLGELLRRYPAPMQKAMRAWSRDKNMWKRRSAILCQLGFKKQTDLKLLYDCIRPNVADKEFFIRKAIGWALRQYAWTDPKEVIRYVKEHESALSPLSKREALKNCGKR